MKDKTLQRKINLGLTDWNPDGRTLVMVLILLVVFSSIFGFIYEELFYRVDLGHFIKRGTTFGPWIPIYGIGGLLISLLACRFRKNPLKVLLLSALVSGLLEFTVGFLLFHLGDGLRLWDYNVEIWNWGNIGGYVCLRSVGFFGISGLFLTYIVVPLFRWFADRVSGKTLTLTALIPGVLFLADVFVSDVLGLGV